MSHFLARLVERARGTAARVEPIVAPRFAPAPITEIATEIEVPPPVRSSEAQSPSPSVAPAQKVVRQKIEPSRGEETRREEAAAAPQPEKLLVPREIPVSTPTPSIVTRIGPSDVVVSPKVNGARPTESLSQPSAARPGSVRPPATRVVTGAVDRDQSSAPSVIHQPPIRANDSHTEPPIVRVTIGRIEVRAETPPAPPPRKTPSPSRPTLSLDAYLKERKEGRR
jgi:hypothetical protein